MRINSINPLSANPTKWSNILKQFVGKLTTDCLRVFDHFVGLALKGLILSWKIWYQTHLCRIVKHTWQTILQEKHKQPKMLMIVATNYSKNNCPILLMTISRLHPRTNITSLRITQQFEIHRFFSFQITIKFIKTYQRAILLTLIIAQSIFIWMTKYKMFYCLQTICENVEEYFIPVIYPKKNE